MNSGCLDLCSGDCSVFILDIKEHELNLQKSTRKPTFVRSFVRSFIHSFIHFLYSNKMFRSLALIVSLAVAVVPEGESSFMTSVIIHNRLSSVHEAGKTYFPEGMGTHQHITWIAT